MNSPTPTIVPTHSEDQATASQVAVRDEHAVSRFRVFKGLAERAFRNPWLRYALLTLSALNFFYTVYLVSNPECGSGEAFHYWAAARRVQQGKPLYKPWPDYGPHILTKPEYPYPGSRFPYPPPMAAAISPVVTKSITFFNRWWTFLLFGSFWVYAGCLSVILCRKLSLEGMLNVGLILTLTPGSTRPFLTGIADPILWMLFGLALTTRFTGVGFIGMAWVKIYAGWPFLFACFRQGKRIAWQGLLTFAAGLAVGLYFCGVQTFIDWFTYFVPVVGQGTFSEYNYSLSMAGLRVFRLLGWEYTYGPLPAWGKLWLTGMEFVMPLAVGLWLRKRDPKLQYACVGVTAAAFAPLFWLSYIPLFLSPVALVARHAWDRAGVPETVPSEGGLVYGEPVESPQAAFAAG